MDQPFVPFGKIPRLSRDVVVTEKLDGTNAQIVIGDDGSIMPGSRTRWITPQNDNYGFAGWVDRNRDELRETLGVGQHFGEWWGAGIQRRYGLEDKRFSLFNVGRWNDDNCPRLCSIVPVLYRGAFDTAAIQAVVDSLAANGSVAAPGFMDPEGVIVFHEASRALFKKTCVKDEAPKGKPTPPIINQSQMGAQ